MKVKTPDKNADIVADKKPSERAYKAAKLWTCRSEFEAIQWAKRLDNYAAKTIELFYDEVCRRAEQNMQKTGRLEGAHYAAMQSVLKEWKERA